MKRVLLWLWGRLPLPNWLRWWVLWGTNPKFLVGVTAVVQDEQGKIMLFKHTYRGQYPWGLPGGWLKQREDPGEAVAREIYEESGLRVRALAPLHAARWSRYPQLELIYLARWEGGTFRPSEEVSAYDFFSAEEFARHAPESAPHILAALEKHA